MLFCPNLKHGKIKLLHFQQRKVYIVYASKNEQKFSFFNESPQMLQSITEMSFFIDDYNSNSIIITLPLILVSAIYVLELAFSICAKLI